MTKIGMTIGGPAQQGPQAGFTRGQSVDWTQPQYATPRPAGKRVLGRHVESRSSAPILSERMIRVRAKPPATHYADDGSPIPADQWVTVPISPSLLEAVERGDLERGADPDSTPPAQQIRRHSVKSSSSE